MSEQVAVDSASRSTLSPPTIAGKYGDRNNAVADIWQSHGGKDSGGLAYYRKDARPDSRHNGSNNTRAEVNRWNDLYPVFAVPNQKVTELLLA